MRSIPSLLLWAAVASHGCTVAVPEGPLESVSTSGRGEVAGGSCHVTDFPESFKVLYIDDTVSWFTIENGMAYIARWRDANGSGTLDDGDALRYEVFSGYPGSLEVPPAAAEVPRIFVVGEEGSADEQIGSENSESASDDDDGDAARAKVLDDLGGPERPCAVCIDAASEVINATLVGFATTKLEESVRACASAIPRET